MRIPLALRALALIALAAPVWCHGFPPPAPPVPPLPPQPATQPCLVLPYLAPQLPGMALSGNVLLYDDCSTVLGTLSPAARACANLGVSATLTTSPNQFSQALTSGAIFDLVVVLNLSPTTRPSNGLLDELASYLAGTGPGSPSEPKVIFHSQQASTTHMASSLFALMGVNLGTGSFPLGAIAHAVPGERLLQGLPDPFSFASPGGFALLHGTPIAGVATSLTQTAGTTGSDFIARNDGRAVFIGFPPHLVGPRPQAAEGWLSSLFAAMLIPASAGDLEVESVTLNPGPGITIGQVISAEVRVRSTYTTPVQTRVDLYCGPHTLAPLLPAAPAALTALVTVPAGGVATVVFPSLPTPLTEECWRLHAMVGGELGNGELYLGNNVRSGGLCVMDMGCARAVGDCSGDGVHSVLDSLVAAQAGAGLLAPAALCACDVDLDSVVTVLDALIIAQVAAGAATLPVPAPVAISPSITDFTPVQTGGAHVWELDICATAPVGVTFEFSLDGGLTWSPATRNSCSPMSASATGVAPAMAMYFAWDSNADVPAALRPTTAELRVQVDDPAMGTSRVHLASGVQVN